MTAYPGNYPSHISDSEWSQYYRDEDEDFRDPPEPEYDNNDD